MTDLGDEINSLLQEHRGDPDKDDCDSDEYKTPAPPRTKRVRGSNLPTFDMADLGENGDSGGDNPSDSPSDHSDDGGCDIRQDASFWAYDGFSCHIDSVLSVLAVCTTWTELETATAPRTSGAGDYLDVALRWDHDDRDARRTSTVPHRHVGPAQSLRTFQRRQRRSCDEGLPSEVRHYTYMQVPDGDDQHFKRSALWIGGVPFQQCTIPWRQGWPLRHSTGFPGT